MRHQSQQEIGVGRPRVTGANRCVTRCTQQIAQCRNADQTHRAGQVANTGHTHEWTQRPAGRSEQAAHGHRRVDYRCAFTYDQVGAPFEAARELGHDAWWIGEVALKQEHRVPTWVSRQSRDVASECVDGARIPYTRFASKHRHGHGVRVLLRYIRRFIVAGVVVDDDLVLARELGEHRAEPPE